MHGAVYFRRTYDETMTLMVEARNYAAYVERREREALGLADGLRMSCEALRVTSRLTQVMAWLMMQRAVQEGEVSPDQALDDDHRLAGAEVCLDQRYNEDETLPGGLRSTQQSWAHA
jgi:regulator of CtrA degradation